MNKKNEVGLLKALFDFKMHHFITMRVIRFLYALSAILIIILGAIVFGAGLAGAYGNGGIRILVAIGAPIGTLFYLILVRLWMEFLGNLYRIGDNTQKMVEKLPSA